jgi:hypothetical protein
VSYEESDDFKCQVILCANEDAPGVHEALWTADGWWPDKSARARKHENPAIAGLS